VGDANLSEETRTWLPVHVLDQLAGPVGGEYSSGQSSVEEAGGHPQFESGSANLQDEEGTSVDLHRITFDVKAENLGVWGSITFMSPKSYSEVRADVDREDGRRIQWDRKGHHSDCGEDDGCSDEHLWCFEVHIFDHLWSSTPALINELHGVGLNIVDYRPPEISSS